MSEVILSKDAASAQYQARGAKGRFASNKGGFSRVEASKLAGNPVAVESAPSEGINNAVIITFSDGSKAIEKDLPQGESIAEILAMDVGEKLGVNVPTTVKHPVSYRAIRQQFVEGVTGTETIKEDPDIMDEIVVSEAGARFAVFDYVMGQQDRHSDNWMRMSNGELIAIDNGRAMIENEIPFFKTNWNIFIAGWGGRSLSEDILEDVSTVLDLPNLPQGVAFRANYLLQYGEIPKLKGY